MAIADCGVLASFLILSFERSSEEEFWSCTLRFEDSNPLSKFFKMLSMAFKSILDVAWVVCSRSLDPLKLPFPTADGVVTVVVAEVEARALRDAADVLEGVVDILCLTTSLTTRTFSRPFFSPSRRFVFDLRLATSLLVSLSLASSSALAEVAFSSCLANSRVLASSRRFSVWNVKKYPTFKFRRCRHLLSEVCWWHDMKHITMVQIYLQL